MKTLIIAALLVSLSLTQISVIAPGDLRQAIADENKVVGSIDYSVSTFGNILYADTSNVEVIALAGNEFGCAPITAPVAATSSKFVYLFEKGECSFSAKAFHTQQTGAFAVLVFYDKLGANVKNIIPSGDSFYNNLKIPIILISRENGLLIKETLRLGKPVFLTVDLELVCSLGYRIYGSGRLRVLAVADFRRSLRLHYQVQERARPARINCLLRAQVQVQELSGQVRRLLPSTQLLCSRKVLRD
jgi:hypothetical protein